MYKKYLSVLITWLIFFPSLAQAQLDNKWEKPFIIPRASWWANSQFNSLTDIYWKEILEKRANYVTPEISQEMIDYNKEKTKKIEDYLYWNFLNQFTSQQTIKTKNEGNYSFAWPLKYTNYVDSIIIHHTHSEYTDTITWLNNIHKYHSLNRQWWDIGYNYIIWYDGRIYEWREGWDYVVWAHSKYNNFGSVWIAIMGNYESEWIDKEQYKSLEQLIQYLIVQYGIDLNKKRYYHRDCSWTKCDTFYIETYLDHTLIWHRDATHTSCPWEKLYEQIQKIRTDNIDFSKWRTPVLRDASHLVDYKQKSTTPKIQKVLSVLRKYSPEQKQNILDLIDMKKNESNDTNTTKSLQIIRLAVVLSLNE